MSEPGQRTTPRSRPLPVFDPGPSGAFAREALDAAQVTGVLIGRLAVWSWLADEARHRFTKDLDLAIAPADLPAVCAWLEARGVQAHDLPMGGVAVRLPVADAGGPSVCVDFITRSNPEWGDFGLLMAELIADAVASGHTVRVGGTTLPVASPTYLALSKLVAGRDKDLEDLSDLLREAEVDVAALRTKLSTTPTLAVLRSRFEELLERVGHPLARRDNHAS